MSVPQTLIIARALTQGRRWRQPFLAGIGAVALLVLGLTEPALAGCSVTPSGNALNNLANGDTATCTGTTISQTGNLVLAIGNTGALTFNTVNLTDTTLDLSSSNTGVGISTGNGSGITLNRSAINITGTAPVNILAGINTANNNVIHLNDSSINITAPGAGSVGEGIQAATGSEVTLTNSQINATGVLAGVGVTGSGLTVVVDNSTINGSSQSVNLAASTLVLATGAQLNSFNGADGSGNSILGLVGSGSEDEVFNGFGTLVIGDWSLTGASNFGGIQIQGGGRLAINGPITSTGIGTLVLADGTLGGNGTLTSTVLSLGTLAPGNSVGTLSIIGNLTQNDGAFEAQFDEHGIDRLTVTGTTTLTGSPVVNVVPLGGSSGGSGVILSSTGGITGSFATARFQGNGAATLVQSANAISLITIDGTAIEANDVAASQVGLDYLDVVNGEQIAGLATCEDSCATAKGPDRAHAWMRGFGRFGSEDSNAGNRPFTYDTAGSALGGDVSIAKGLRLGGSFGYSYTDVDLTDHGGTTDINSTLAALYATYQSGRFFATATAGGGWQGYDISRQVTVNGVKDQANARTDGFLANAGIQGGLQLHFPGNWLLVPSAGVSYQHKWVKGYQEHGGSTADVVIDGHQSDALRLKSELWLGRDLDLTDLTLTPHLSIGVAQQFAFGGTAGGSFSSGSSFDVALNDRDRTVGLIGLGIDAAFSDGLTTYLAYDGQFAATGHVHAITAGLRYSW